MSSEVSRRRLLLPSLALAAVMLATIGIYWQTHAFEFVTLDDAEYVTENHMVTGGLTAESIRWAFTTVHFFNWHPLTWLSLMLDVELFGVDPGAHHLVNVAIHLANTLLVAWLLIRTTRRVWLTLIVAAAFALHPMHVESVAWISERKDVLAAFWALLALLLYERFTRSGSVRWFAACTLSLVVSLMAKPMAVTLPCVMLLLDYWPLGRLTISPSPQGPEGQAPISIVRSVAEKVPLLLIVILSGVATVFAQQQDGAVTSLGGLPIWARLANAAIAYGTYGIKLVVPTELSVFYPHPGTAVSVPLAVASTIGIALVTGAVFSTRRWHPEFLIGWLWFIGMLVPVIGILQVGMQAMADRYSYLPSIGFFILVVHGASVGMKRLRARRHMAATVAIIWLAGLTVMGWAQISTWRDSESLFGHALSLDADNWRAHGCLGDHLARTGRLPEATVHLQRAIELQPGYTVAHFNLGLVHLRSGRFIPAIEHLRRAAELEPSSVTGHLALGSALAMTGDFDGAIIHHRRARDLAPEDPLPWTTLGTTLEKAGFSEEADRCFATASSLRS